MSSVVTVVKTNDPSNPYSKSTSTGKVIVTFQANNGFTDKMKRELSGILVKFLDSSENPIQNKNVLWAPSNGDQSFIIGGIPSSFYMDIVPLVDPEYLDTLLIQEMNGGADMTGPKYTESTFDYATFYANNTVDDTFEVTISIDDV